MKGPELKPYQLLGAFAKLKKKVTIRFVKPRCLIVRPSAWNIYAPTGRIFLNFDTRIFFENLSRK